MVETAVTPVINAISSPTYNSADASRAATNTINNSTTESSIVDNFTTQEQIKMDQQ